MRVNPGVQMSGLAALKWKQGTNPLRQTSVFEADHEPVAAQESRTEKTNSSVALLDTPK